MTEGETREEAAENLEEAMRAWVQARFEDGDAIPEAPGDAPSLT
jgi:predicted RNase H-like HicB family nuclease